MGARNGEIEIGGASVRVAARIKATPLSSLIAPRSC
jgi:hypothetical protein